MSVYERERVIVYERERVSEFVREKVSECVCERVSEGVRETCGGVNAAGCWAMKPGSGLRV